jgi:superfamily I DNA/RNA helicase
MVSKEFHIKNIKQTDKQYSGKKFLLYLREAISEVKTSELYTGTIHSVKGLEYDNVFVMNVGSYNFKLSNEDEKNLFYVAVTRAKNRLFVYELFANY